MQAPVAKVVTPLSMDEVAAAWGWNYNTTTSRLRRAWLAGRLSRFQRPGHQPYYLAEQVEAVFGPPPNSDIPLESHSSQVRQFEAA